MNYRLDTLQGGQFFGHMTEMQRKRRWWRMPSYMLWYRMMLRVNNVVVHPASRHAYPPHMGLYLHRVLGDSIKK